MSGTLKNKHTLMKNVINFKARTSIAELVRWRRIEMYNFP